MNVESTMFNGINTFTDALRSDVYRKMEEYTFDFIDSLMTVFPKYYTLLAQGRERLLAAIGAGHSQDVFNKLANILAERKFGILQKDQSLLKELCQSVEILNNIDLYSDWNVVRPELREVMWCKLQRMTSEAISMLQKSARMGPLINMTTDERRKLVDQAVQLVSDIDTDNLNLESKEDTSRFIDTIIGRIPHAKPIAAETKQALVDQLHTLVDGKCSSGSPFAGLLEKFK